MALSTLKKSVVATILLASFLLAKPSSEVIYNQLVFGIKPKMNEEARYSVLIQKKLNGLMKKIEVYESKQSYPKKSFEYREVLRKKRNALNNMKALSHGKLDEKVLNEFDSTIVFSYEWEGFSGGPINESKQLQQFLSVGRDSVVNDYVSLILAFRLRVAFECLTFEKKKESAKEYLDRYEKILILLKYSSNILIRVAAEEMDAKEYLYIRVKR